MKVRKHVRWIWRAVWGVSQPTVAKMLTRLAEEGLVARKPYRGVFLTRNGRTMVEAVRARHRVVEAFLLALGISSEHARVDAEGMEHYASAETLAAFQAAMNAGLEALMARAKHRP